MDAFGASDERGQLRGAKSQRLRTATTCELQGKARIARTLRPERVILAQLDSP